MQYITKSEIYRQKKWSSIRSQLPYWISLAAGYSWLFNLLPALNFYLIPGSKSTEWFEIEGNCENCGNCRNFGFYTDIMCNCVRHKFGKLRNNVIWSNKSCNFTIPLFDKRAQIAINRRLVHNYEEIGKLEMVLGEHACKCWGKMLGEISEEIDQKFSARPGLPL